MSSMSRKYCFTLNNYTDVEVEELKKVHCQFLQFGKEVGENGTPHLQGFIYFKNATTLKALKKKIPRAHIEAARGTIAQNLKYTGKDGDITKIGEPPISSEECGKKGAEFYKAAREAMREGRVDDIPEQMKTMHPNLCKRHRLTYLAEQELSDVTDKHQWYSGGPGTGKSRKAREVTQNKHYDKDFSKWWDGYEDQEYVLIDDIDKSHAYMLASIKRMADRYPFPAESKGTGKVQIRPRQIIVTSNFTIEEIWPDEKDHGPIKRRFDSELFH